MPEYKILKDCTYYARNDILKRTDYDKNQVVTLTDAAIIEDLIACKYAKEVNLVTVEDIEKEEQPELDISSLKKKKKHR